VGNAADAEDLTRYQRRGRFTAWMFQIARNKAMDHFRSNRKLSDLSESLADTVQATALEAVYQKESHTHLKALMRMLNDDERGQESQMKNKSMRKRLAWAAAYRRRRRSL